MSVAYILSISSVASGIFPILTGLYNYRQLDKTLKIVLSFFVLSFLSDLGEVLTAIMGVANNQPLIHLFIVISLVFFGALYYRVFFKDAFKKAIIILTALALIIVIINAIFIEGIWDYPSISNTVLCVLLIFYSLAYFYQLLTRQEFIHIEKLGLFWINAGVLFYYSINIFLFMLFERIIHVHKDNFEDYYMIHIITNIIANIIFSVGLLCKPQRTT